MALLRTAFSRAADLNFDWITPELAVGGQPALLGVGRWALRHRIRAIIDLRREKCDDAGILQGHGLGFLHLPTVDQGAVSQDMLEGGVAFAGRWLAEGANVLVHCEYGIGRSPTLALCIMVADGMTPLEALTEIKNRRPCISPSPAQYEAWAEWLRRRGDEPPSFAVFRDICYRKGNRGNRRRVPNA
jgi:Dual specificity phosphatase, catalytic domain